MSSVLVIGGARSGKSRYAQSRAEATGLRPVFLATAQACDDEMCARIAQHQAERDMRWQAVEAPLELAEAIAANSAPDRVLMVDCLTLWVTNLMMSERNVAVATDSLIAAIAETKGAIILVSNEVGWGIVPDNALARRFRDEAGRVNQRVASCVSEVQLVVAGLSLRMK